MGAPKHRSLPSDPEAVAISIATAFFMSGLDPNLPSTTGLNRDVQAALVALREVHALASPVSR